MFAPRMDAPLPQAPGHDARLPTITRAQLSLRNGQDRPEIWVAYRGWVYDVSRSRLWLRGRHYEHWAGQDLTEELDRDAPHSAALLEAFERVGQLATLT